MDSNPGNCRKALALLASAIVLAAAVRLYLLWQYYCISSDGVHYIDAAKDFFAGRISAGLSSVYPPGYPLLIALLYPLTGDWELSSQIWSLLCGVLLLVPLYILCRDIYGDRVALIGCFLAAVSPYLARYSVHVRTESPFIFLSTVALVLFHQGIQHGSNSRFFYGSLVAGFAYLVRPEAIGFLVIVPFVLGLRWWIKREPRLSRLFQTCALVFLGFSLFALPYISYLSMETGHWGAISRKAGVTLAISLKGSDLLDGGELQDSADFESLVFLDFVRNHPLLYGKKVAMDILPAVGAYFEALHYSYVPFLLIGLFLVFRERFWERKDFLLLSFALFYVVGLTLVYVKRRYSVQVVPVSLGWTALGMLWCWGYFKEFPSARVSRILLPLGVLVFAAGTIPKTLKPISPEKGYVREAGRYLKQLRGSRELRVLAFDDRIGFYAQAERLSLSDLKEASLIENLREGKADYLATDLSLWQERFPRVARDPERYGLALAREFRGWRKDRLVIYRVS
jgi:4-amino-4-deoxy-L-arabinose transferase-like glycosyltransferase